MAAKIRVVVADDSPFLCRLLTSYLHSASEIEVVGTALDGARAIEKVRLLEPDVLTLDLEMPHMNGLDALRTIMSERPTPTVVVSGVSGRAATMTLQALDFGAIDFVLKFCPGSDLDPEAVRREIVSKVIQASRIRVVRSLRPSSGEDAATQATRATRRSVPAPAESRTSPHDVIVIGASTGGPVALREVLGRLPADFAHAILLVQHMPASFTAVLAAQLERQLGRRVREAEPDDRPSPETILVAPGETHLLLAADGRVELWPGPEICGHRPSIDATMQSAAQALGSRAHGVLLTGMGNDGVMGMLTIRNHGGMTLAQDEASCVVYGMPRLAVEQGAVAHVGSPAELGQMIARLDVLTRRAS